MAVNGPGIRGLVHQYHTSIKRFSDQDQGRLESGNFTGKDFTFSIKFTEHFCHLC